MSNIVTVSYEYGLMESNMGMKYIFPNIYVHNIAIPLISKSRLNGEDFVQHDISVSAQGFGNSIGGGLDLPQSCDKSSKMWNMMLCTVLGQIDITLIVE